MNIYKVTNKVNGKIYIGLTTKSLDERIKTHKRAYKHTEYAFHRALRKYGFENFEFKVVEKVSCKEELLRAESRWINATDSMNPKIGYNMINQEDGLKVFSGEVRSKMSKVQIKRFKEMSKEEKKKVYSRSAISHQGKRKTKNKYCGVFPTKFNTYETGITYNSKRYRKCYDDEMEAAKSYDRLALYLYGNDAKLNFEDERSNYLKEDLEIFIEQFNKKQKLGRKGKKLYSYHELLEESKVNAKNNIDEIDIKHSDILELKFLYDGSINPEFLLKHDI